MLITLISAYNEILIYNYKYNTTTSTRNPGTSTTILVTSSQQALFTVVSLPEVKYLGGGFTSPLSPARTPTVHDDDVSSRTCNTNLRGDRVHQDVVTSCARDEFECNSSTHPEIRYSNLETEAPAPKLNSKSTWGGSDSHLLLVPIQLSLPQNVTHFRPHAAGYDILTRQLCCTSSSAHKQGTCHDLQLAALCSTPLKSENVSSNIFSLHLLVITHLQQVRVKWKYRNMDEISPQ